jgi:hypothetical protein
MPNAPQLIQRNHHAQVLEASYGARNILAITIPMLVGGPYLDFCSPVNSPKPGIMAFRRAQSIFYRLQCDCPNASLKELVRRWSLGRL